MRLDGSVRGGALGRVLAAGGVLLGVLGRVASVAAQQAPVESTLAVGPALPSPGRALSGFAEVEQLLRAHAFSLQEARGRQLETEGVTRQRLGELLPQLSGVLGVTQELFSPRDGQAQVSPSGRGFNWQAAAVVRVPLLVPRGWYDHGTALEAEVGAKLALKDANRRVLAGAVDDLLALYAAEQLYGVGESSLRIAGTVAELTERGRGAGFATVVDVTRAKQEQAQIQIRNSRLGDDVLKARDRLGRDLGLATAVGISAALTPENVLDNLGRHCSALHAADERADVGAERSALKVAERDLSSTKLALLPSIDAFSALRYNSDVIVSVPETMNLSSNGLHSSWTIGATLAWSIFDGGVRYGRQKEAKGRLEIARARLDATSANATRELEEATALLQLAKQRVQAATANKELAVEAARLATAAFESGRGTSYELLESHRRLWLAESELVLTSVGLRGAEAGRLLSAADCRL